MRKENVRMLVEGITFLIIIFYVFCSVSYLFRFTGLNRERITGIKNEKKLDMVYVGGSAAFQYWQPLKAWNDCGFTSYDYAVNTMQAESILYCLKEAKKQNPMLFVIDLRAFMIWLPQTQSNFETGLRNVADSMDITSINKYRMVYDFLRNREMPEDTDWLSYYLDIVKYHTNKENLILPEAWAFIHNEYIDKNKKGYSRGETYCYLEQPIRFQTEEKNKLHPQKKKILKNLLEYIKKENKQALFVVSPFYTSLEYTKELNALKNVIEEYGFTCIDTNYYYDKMELDFTRDFCDINHVNCLGAEKYTLFLEKFIVENYDMPCHKNDINYEDWNTAYTEFNDEESECKVNVENLIKEVWRGNDISTEMNSTNDIFEWYTLASDSRYTLLLLQRGKLDTTLRQYERNILDGWEINESLSGAIRVISGGEIIYSNASDGMDLYQGEIGVWKNISYELYNENANVGIKINGDNYGVEENSIRVVVIDNNFLEVVDDVNIIVENGTLTMRHIK